MARTKNVLLTGVKVSKAVLDKEFVIKTRMGKTFLTRYPDMSNVVPSASQLEAKSKFAAAVEHAREIINDPVRKANYKVHPGSTVYHSAIKDYLKKRS
ncbi:hypothetical protein [Chitinophaga ginsengisoli]|uniref:Uncharacterized protein n=1 Tax=Chitinophaga ginsengisoli TaxID=363837 RepID=A0A2P8G2B2_9BACT|nr:hypothetical protein [Chitinophaga ginsengisoli]PSL28120.1 hypothetical protein CLV42_10839 [Chitinophaga ginsengisoli]